MKIKDDVDPMIIYNMKERLNPKKKFSYSDGDHLKDSIEYEKKMREKAKKIKLEKIKNGFYTVRIGRFVFEIEKKKSEYYLTSNQMGDDAFWGNYFPNLKLCKEFLEKNYLK